MFKIWKSYSGTTWKESSNVRDFIVYNFKSFRRDETFLENVASLDKKTIQGIVDQFVIKQRLVRHLRTKEYNELFAEEPTWTTEVIEGLNI